MSIGCSPFYISNTIRIVLKIIPASVKAAEIAIRGKYIVDCVLTYGVSKIDRIKIF
jgi:ferritin-like protein